LLAATHTGHLHVTALAKGAGKSTPLTHGVGPLTHHGHPHGHPHHPHGVSALAHHAVLFLLPELERLLMSSHFYLLF
jgi:hypothetical protein